MILIGEQEVHTLSGESGIRGVVSYGSVRGIGSITHSHASNALQCDVGDLEGDLGEVPVAIVVDIFYSNVHSELGHWTMDDVSETR